MKLKNFTPLDDTLAQTYGVIYAAVIGLMWRWQDMNGVCQLSQQAIADKLGIKDRGTVANVQKQAVLNGHLIDTTPNLRNVAHTYKVFGMQVRVELETVVDQVEVDQEVRIDADGAGNFPTAVLEKPAPGAGKTRMKKHIRDTKKEELNEERKKNADRVRKQIEANRKQGKTSLDGMLAFAVPPDVKLAWEAVDVFESTFNLQFSRNDNVLKFGKWLHGEIMKGHSVADFRAYIAADNFRMSQIAYWNDAYTGWAGKIAGQWSAFLLAKSESPSQGPTRSLA